MALALLASTLLAFPGAAKAEGAAQTCNPAESHPADATLTRAQWLSPGRLQVRAGVGEGLTVTVSGRVNFGPFRHEWKAASLPFGSGEMRILDLSVPKAAFMHPLASTYLADLLVRVETHDSKGRPRQEVALDNLYVAWPQGLSAPAQLWNDETQPPHGVLDPQLQKAASRVSPNARLGPPLGHLPVATRAAEEDTTGEDTPLSEQLPADPNDEETF